jgi:hypothetical protein
VIRQQILLFETRKQLLGPMWHPEGTVALKQCAASLHRATLHNLHWQCLLTLHASAGTLGDGQVFDSTRGDDLKYRDGGYGVYRPAVVRISGSPVPGICLGLQQAIQGMKIGGKRVAKVPASLAFGDKTVLAPFAIVPGGSTVQYDIELLRVSSVGPDLLVKVSWR